MDVFIDPTPVTVFDVSDTEMTEVSAGVAVPFVTAVITCSSSFGAIVISVTTGVIIVATH